MAELMDGQEEVVVEKRAEEVGYCQYLQPTCIVKRCSSAELKQDNHSNLQHHNFIQRQ